MSSSDLEKGLATASVRPIASPVEDLHPLEVFQILVGINSHERINNNPGRAHHNLVHRITHNTEGRNIGLYEQAKRREKTARRAYIATSTISNSLYMLQITLAAAFTALSAYKDTSAIVLTILGAVNTVVAG